MIAQFLAPALAAAYVSLSITNSKWTDRGEVNKGYYLRRDNLTKDSHANAGGIHTHAHMYIHMQDVKAKGCTKVKQIAKICKDTPPVSLCTDPIENKPLFIATRHYAGSMFWVPGVEAEVGKGSSFRPCHMLGWTCPLHYLGFNNITFFFFFFFFFKTPPPKKW